MMPTLAVVLSLAVLVAAPIVEARAGDAETIADVNKAAAALDEAFERQDVENVKKLMTPDHIAVAPYYSGPQSVDDQIASLPDLKFAQEIAGKVTVSLIGDAAALRTFKAKQKGSFKGRPLPEHVFVSQLMVKQDGAWVERFYQVTALGPHTRMGRHMGKHKGRRGCRFAIGTYLTKNKPKGASGESFASRSLLSLGSAHLILFADSGESGEAGFAPFTDGRGTWYCRADENGKLKVTATTLDFTAATSDWVLLEADPGTKPGIGRLDFDLTFDERNRSIAGIATLYLLPLDGDPLDKSALKDGREFEITGQSIGTPGR